MPRGRRPDPKTTDEKIAAIEAQITGHQTALADLTSKLQELKVQKDKEDLELLLEVIHNTGRSVQDIITEIQGNIDNQEKAS
jgi:uncharacterized protein YoxC